MLDKLKEILKDKGLLEKLATTEDEKTAARLVVDASAKQGYGFTVEDVMAALRELFAPKPSDLSEEDLKAVSGGAMMGTETGTAYGIGCPTKYLCGTNICTKYKGTNC